MMEDLTTSHVATARANRAYALAILQDEGASPASLNWAAVATFYSALHFINGYLWEIARLAPANHLERERIIARWPDLAPHDRPFRLLLDYSIRARYTPGFQIRRSDLSVLLHRHHANIARSIESRLDSQP
jgi:hypothetical protein